MSLTKTIRPPEPRTHDALPTDGVKLSVPKMVDYKTTRMCVAVLRIKYDLALNDSKFILVWAESALRPTKEGSFMLLEHRCSKILGSYKLSSLDERVLLYLSVSFISVLEPPFILQGGSNVSLNIKQ